MIIYKDWIEEKNGNIYTCEGYYLFGFIPIFISKYNQDVPGNDKSDNFCIIYHILYSSLFFYN